MKNCKRINDGSIGCRESYLKNAIINLGQRRNWTRERGRGESVYLWNTWPRILGGSERIPIGALTINEFFRRLCSLVVSVLKGIQDGSIDVEEGWVWSGLWSNSWEAIEEIVDNFGNWAKFSTKRIRDIYSIWIFYFIVYGYSIVHLRIFNRNKRIVNYIIKLMRSI